MFYLVFLRLKLSIRQLMPTKNFLRMETLSGLIIHYIQNAWEELVFLNGMP